MKRLYSSQDSLMLGHLKRVLEEHRIRCLVKNEHLSGASGELPPIECWPELWVLNDADWQPAREIMNAIVSVADSVGEPWRCPRCGEQMEAQFTDCWRCGGGARDYLLA